MRIGVDARHLAGDRGVAHYTSAILAALVSRHPEEEWRLLVPGVGRVAAADALAAHESVVVVRTSAPGRLLHGAGSLVGRPRIDRLLGGVDVLWSPAPSPGAISATCPTVLTVHDLSFEERSRDFTVYERAWHRLARPRSQAFGAAAVIVNSAATRDAVRRRWRLDAKRMAVVPEGVSVPPEAPPPEAISAVLERHGIAGRYLLCVGALEPRKAPELLVRAHARARRAGLEAELVFAGRGRLARRLRGQGSRLLGWVPDGDVDALYRGALALVMPSHLEGFGLPPLEALARGTPPVVSDLPVYHETLGAGALRFPAGDETALAQALVAIASDERLRASIVSTGAAAIAGLSWERAARETHAVLARAAGGGDRR